MQKIDIYRVMKAAFSGALNQGNKTTIDYASSCILPAALQLPLTLVIVNQVSFDVLNYMSLRQVRWFVCHGGLHQPGY